MTDKQELELVHFATVICGDKLYSCRCGLVPGHTGDHECAEPDPQCGGSWRDDTEDEHAAFVMRWPGIRPSGPCEGLIIDGVLGDPDPTGPGIPIDRGTRPRQGIRVPALSYPTFFGNLLLEEPT